MRIADGYRKRLRQDRDPLVALTLALAALLAWAVLTRFSVGPFARFA